jgi:hypothetical protein
MNPARILAALSRHSLLADILLAAALAALAAVLAAILVESQPKTVAEESGLGELVPAFEDAA